MPFIEVARIGEASLELNLAANVLRGMRITNPTARLAVVELSSPLEPAYFTDAHRGGQRTVTLPVGREVLFPSRVGADGIEPWSAPNEWAVYFTLLPE